MGNFPDGGNTQYTSGTNQTDTFSFPTSLMVFLSSLNILLSITATLGNSLILIALCKEISLHPPTKLLFRCMAFTDLCVGSITQPLFVNLLLRIAQLEMNADDVEDDKVASIFSYALCGASVSTATAISLDRLLALLLGLRYRQLVTVTRVRSVVACIWFLAASCGLVRLWNYHAPLKIAVFFGGLLSIISVSSHMKIWCRLHHQRFQVRDRLYHRKVNEVAQYKKTVSSIAWVQLVLLACYVPFLSVSMLISVGFRGKMIYIAWLSTATLVYLNSTLNPIVYFWKMTEVRRRVKETIQQCLCL